MNAAQRCDGVVDCPHPDGSDELDCNFIDNEIDTYRKFPTNTTDLSNQSSLK